MSHSKPDRQVSLPHSHSHPPLRDPGLLHHGRGPATPGFPQTQRGSVSTAVLPGSGIYGFPGNGEDQGGSNSVGNKGEFNLLHTEPR